jgi:formate dehydrogenase subunit delta
MKVDNLITMANQIGTFFESYPDRAEASSEIAGHLKRFWAPRMRGQLLRHIDQQQGDGLSPLVLSSITAHRALLAPALTSPAAPG